MLQNCSLTAKTLKALTSFWSVIARSSWNHGANYVAGGEIVPSNPFLCEHRGRITNLI